jgi:hypothetical protein
MSVPVIYIFVSKIVFVKVPKHINLIINYFRIAYVK